MASPHRRQSERAGRWVAVLGASLLVHVTVLSALAAGTSTTKAPKLDAIDITFTVVTPDPPELSEPTTASTNQATPKERAASVPASVQVPGKSRRRSRRTPAATPGDIRKSPDPAPSSVTLFDPTEDARAFVIAQEPFPTERAGGEGADEHADGPDPFEGVGRKRYLSKREPPQLQPHRDGTYRYKGTSFKAIVERDGSVTFDDGYRQSATIAFDLTDHMMRKRGDDPYRVEKNWFLEGTEAFRDELFERWRAKQARIALDKLRGHLVRIFEDDMLSTAQKEAKVVALYRDTANDEPGAAARQTIADFVKEQMPTTVLPAPTR